MNLLINFLTLSLPSTAINLATSSNKAACGQMCEVIQSDCGESAKDSIHIH